jgi:hypothetical protein
MADLGAAALYGREQDLQRVADSAAALLLVTGDTGVGKSGLLQVAQAEAANAVAPPPVTLKCAPGSLQNGLLAALADATAELINERGLAAKALNRLTIVAKEMARDGGKRLGQVVAAELLNLVRGRIGAQAGDAVAEFLKDMRDAGNEELSQRIRSMVEPTIAATIVGYGQEVAQLAGDGQIVILALDRGEGLADKDLRLLADLVDAIPTRLRIRLGFATEAENHRAAVENLLAHNPNVDEYAVKGITAEAVRNWFTDVGIEVSQAEAVHRVSAGYPLLIGPLIDHLADGGNVDEAPSNESFFRSAKGAWTRLSDPTARRTARRLAVIRDPMPEAHLRQLCDIDVSGWADTVTQLQRARIFSTTVNGAPWFHEQRRLMIYRELSTEEREAYSADAAAVLATVARETREPLMTAEVADLVQESHPSPEKWPQIFAIVGLDRVELAVAAALVELSQVSARSAVPVGFVLGYARSVFGAEGDLLSTVDRMADLGLVALGENAVATRFDDLGLATIQGRSLLELGRAPIPSLAFAAFAALCSLGRGADALPGYGHLPFADLAQTYNNGRTSREGRPCILVHAEYFNSPLSGLVDFPSKSARDRAMERTSGFSLDLAGGQLRILHALPHPTVPIPRMRFANALRRLGRHMFKLPEDWSFPGHWGVLPYGQFQIDTGPGWVDPPYIPEEYMRVVFAVNELVWNRSTEAERLATDSTVPPSIHWHYENGRLFRYDVVGSGSDLVQHRSTPTYDSSDSSASIRFAQAFGLKAHQRVAHLWGIPEEALSRDPMADRILELSLRAREFNRAQDPFKLPLARERLEYLLLEARRREVEDANALLSVLPESRRPGTILAPRSLHVLLSKSESEGSSGRMDTFARYQELESHSGHEEVSVRFVWEEGDFGSKPEDSMWFLDTTGKWQERMGSDDQIAHGPANSVIGEMLGFGPGELALVTGAPAKPDRSGRTSRARGKSVSARRSRGRGRR